jgi:hypothetical protein
MCPIGHPEGVIRNGAANGYDADCKEREENRCIELLFHGFVLAGESHSRPDERVLTLLTDRSVFAFPTAAKPAHTSVVACKNENGPGPLKVALRLGIGDR